jgi:hypothetical protein
LKLAEDRTRDQHVMKESGKKVLKLDENEIVARRRVRDDSH